jgi:hypothetical protein
MTVRQFFLIFVLFCSAFAFNVPNLTIGPNFEYGAFGSAAPAHFKGAFIPQLNTNVDFSWIEPLGANGYGTWVTNKTNYIRFMVGTELSPFYGTLRAGIGIAPLPPPFAVLELSFVYSNENLFWNDVEMPMKPDESPSISETWNTEYIFDKLYKNSSYSQVQSYDIRLGGKYTSQILYLSFLLHFTLIDITSDYDKKSFDYTLGIPLFSRDYVLAEEMSAIYNFGKNFSWNAEFVAMLSGRQFKFYAPFKAYDKEPLSYYIISTGPLWRFSGGKSYLSVSPGFFMRNSKDNVFRDSLKEKILLSIQYKYFWNIKFEKE